MGERAKRGIISVLGEWRRVVVLGGTLCLTTTGLQAATIVTNGSFEQGPPIKNPPQGFDSYVGGDTAIVGWVVTGQGVDFMSTFWPASDGVRSLDLNSLQAGGVKQTVATVIGQEYRVTFDMAANTVGSPTLKKLQVSAAGQTSPEFIFDATGHSPASMGWESHEWDFFANSTSTDLLIMSTIQGGYGPALDNVAVQPIPEPGSVLVLTLLVPLGLRRRIARFTAI